MIERFHNGKLTWLNLKHPTEHDVEEVTREQKLPAHVMGDLLAPVPRNYALTYEGIIKVAIDFPVVKRIHAHHPYEVKFIITKHALITVQYEEMEGLDRFKKQFEVLTTLGKTSKKMSGPHLFFILMNELYNTSSSKLDYVESGIADIETEIFNDNERQMVLEIAKTNKRLIAFRHVLRAHEDMFFELEPAMLVLYKDEHRVDIANLRKTFMLLSHRTNALFEILSSVRDANDAVLTAKQNETIKTLTIMAFITFPLTLFSSMFGMNTEKTPIIGHDYDFWIIVFIMVCVTASFFTFFKYKKWM